MKLLMIYTDKFSYQPTQKTLDDNFTDYREGKSYESCIVGFIQVEEADEEKKPLKVEKNLAKNLKWAARKTNTQRIILHSFAHLSESKASPEYSQEILNMAEERLKNTDYETAQTPFGYFLDLDIRAPGFSQARMFKSF